MLQQAELVRYNRQLIIPDFGEEGQRKLKGSHVLMIGMGGLGCASATYLTAAGVGHITIVDFDSVELSDLNRQILYWEEDIGEKKVLAAQRKLSKLNPLIKITPLSIKVKEDNASSIIKGAQVVLDGTDNVNTRLTINSVCVRLRVPYIYAGVSRLRGMVSTIIPGETPCLSCFRPEGTSGLGVVGAVPAIIANIQALEAIKMLTGHSPALAGKLLLFNGDSLKFQIHEVRRDKSCPVCSLLHV